MSLEEHPGEEKEGWRKSIQIDAILLKGVTFRAGAPSNEEAAF